MKAVVYYNQNYNISLRGLINSLFVLPIIYISLNTIYNDILISLVMSFMLASFICLFHFKNVSDSFVFYNGFALIIAGLITFDRSKTTTEKLETFIKTFFTILLCGMIIYYSNLYFFGVIPDQNSQGSIYSLSFILFSIFTLSMYGVLLLKR